MISINKLLPKKERIFYLYSVIALVLAIYLFYQYLASSHPEIKPIFVRYFILDTSNLNTNIFLSSYTHINFVHLFENIILYSLFLIMSFQYIEDKKKFKSLMIRCLLIFPIVNSFLLIPFIESGMGLSGIVKCLQGYLFFASYRYVKDKYHLPINVYHVFIFIPINILSIFLFLSLSNISVPSYILLFIVPMLIILPLLYIEQRFSKKSKIENVISILLENSKTKMLGNFKIGFYTLAFIIIFIIPYESFIPSRTTGWESHLIGWIYGLIVSGRLLLQKQCF
ncbi:hypothetical protein [Methanohalophilus halophilus]|uniref:Rhomboid family intramembrane serine protease n=1 Tax=Methanohalophilus halophilus TaxID=2177 RepID=A0A1L3PZP5_9EURY|nr:hypothetical protein [Methanohalophilus halophilus]APH38096.1 hypothetical protein BHR79_00445 [Methanohalophilus halophilus]RNI11040.1 hypothetical protein EFE40_02360 [Methanohalophilus halophilus]SDW83108.1 hypothetical protein SAMN04515625_1690 [Methanohalophilus halophilus]